MITMWVSPDGDDEFGDGSYAHPLKTLDRALELTVKGDEVALRPGDYQGLPELIEHGVKVTVAGTGQVRIDGTVLAWDEHYQPALEA